ncbi:Leukocyte Immunoglobulin-Like Receptor Subfamily A Member 5 [Manis pentadactyla]|nr:Leukocyte Immunoglobulin-Like Receptor Subfamily A Member 5 [Manis pentadactyla]
MTIWCQGTLGAQWYHLEKEGSSESWDKQKPLGPGDKATFSIPDMTRQRTGMYRCSYHSPTGCSECSDRLELWVSGCCIGSPPGCGLHPAEHLHAQTENNTPFPGDSKPSVYAAPATR